MNIAIDVILDLRELCDGIDVSIGIVVSSWDRTLLVFGFVQCVCSTRVGRLLNLFISKHLVQGPCRTGTGGLLVYISPRGYTY